MIPKNLLLGFLSVSITQEPPSGADRLSQHDNRITATEVHDLRAIAPEICTTDNKASYGAQKPVVVEVKTHSVHADSTVEIDFDSFPSGAWDQSTIINGDVQLFSDGDARIWSVKDAFPDLKLPHGGNNAWGRYPAGTNISVKYTDGAKHNAQLTAGFIVNGKLTAARAYVSGRNNGKETSGNAWDLKDGQWLSVRDPYWSDEIYVSLQGNIPSGVLLLERYAYDTT